MDLNKPHGSLTPQEQDKVTADLGRVKQYGSPRKVWVEDGHVFLERHDGEIVSMTAEVSIEIGRMLSVAGTDALINRVMGEHQRMTEEG